MQQTPHIRVAIIGSGFGGLGTAIRLKQDGIEDFMIFERAEAVGGVWRDNRYPGCACDVESHLYSFSFALNPGWSHRFSGQREIWSYLERCVDDYGITPHLRFGHDVVDAVWDDDRARWAIETSRGSFTADVLVAAPGALSEPRIPELPRLESFEGRVIHSARWDESLELEGKRVAVIGTGASSIQIVPAIQPEVGRLVVYQRTPPWIVPRRDRALSGRIAGWMERVPLLRRLVRGRIYGLREAVGVVFRRPALARVLERSARRHLESQIADPRLRKLLTPTYTMGCKRVLLSDDYYPALTKPNVEIVAGGAVEVRAGGIVAEDGTERPADVIVFGTGFQVTEFPFARRVQGRDGTRLSAAWGASPKAHLGTTVAGFPNLFILQGPNTGLGHTSVILMIEAQIEHVLNALRYMDAYELTAIEPKAETQAAFVEQVDRDMEGTVWMRGGCRSWYLDETGRNSTLWPGSVRSFRRRVEPFEPDEYRLRRSPSTSHRAAAAHV